MILRIEPITTIIISILLGWGWYEVVNEPICDVHESHYNKTVEVPYKCSEVMEPKA